MEQVYISRRNKDGDKVVNAIGFLDTENKTLIVPKYIKAKDLNVIDTIKYESALKKDEGYVVITYEGYKDNFYVNNYWVVPTTKKGGAK